MLLSNDSNEGEKGIDKRKNDSWMVQGRNVPSVTGTVLKEWTGSSQNTFYGL